MITEAENAKILLGKGKGSPELMLYVAGSKKLLIKDSSDASKYSQAPVQLMEQGEYEYKFVTPGFHFLLEDIAESKNDDGSLISIIYPSKKYADWRKSPDGMIRTGNYVGHCSLPFAYNGMPVGVVELEIRSVKMDYESEYQQMLKEITEEYTDIIMQQGAPVTSCFHVDHTQDAKTLYQQFCFLKSGIESDIFRAAVYKIQSSPIKRWEHTTEERPICNIKRIGRNEAKQIVSRGNRFNAKGLSCDLPAVLTSLPSHIAVASKVDTLDNQENRFVKYALTQFLVFCKELQSLDNAGVQLKRECEHTANILESFLRLSVFKNVTEPKTLEFNSPALTRKEGYREVFEQWIFFSLAALFGWPGGDKVYHAGKRNVACLYEYWLFFQLRKIFISIFKCSGNGEIVSFSKDRINLNLMQGRQLRLSGIFDYRFGHRHLNGALYYNRTFSHRTRIDVAGSWTEQMRPDYTLSIWPGIGVSEAEAEKNDTIVHIHFDAKYKVSHFKAPEEVDEGADSKILDERKEEEENGIYKQADILKMHAYKDAIRRTSGAYIIYPGDKENVLRGFHEIIPGLGAFCMKPTKPDNGANNIRHFIGQLIIHHLDRLSQREKMSKYQHNIFSEPNDARLRASIPDSIIADETFVLVGYYNCVNKDFVYKTGYNVRIGSREGSIDVTPDLLKVRYALLYNENGDVDFVKIKEGTMHIFMQPSLIEKGYLPGRINSSFAYLLFPLEEAETEPEFKNIEWHKSRINRYMNHLGYRRKPAPILLSDILLANNRLTDD